MTKTHKIKKSISKKTKTKTKKRIIDCPIGLKPFEESFSKAMATIKTPIYKKKAFVKQLLSKFAPNSITPNDDFYNYINYEWLKEVSLEEQQKYIVQIDNFRLTQDKVYRQLNEIIVDYIKNNNNVLSKNLKNYYTSVVTMNPKSYSKVLAREAEHKVCQLIQNNNPWELLAYYNKDEMISIYAPFVWTLNPDDKNTTKYCSFISPHTFELLDLNVYYDDGTEIEYKKKYRYEYNKNVKDIFNITLGKNNYNPQDVFDVEVEIFNALGCDTVSKTEKAYNKVFAAESLSKYGFDWSEFTKQLGYKTVPSFFVTSSLNYLMCGTTLFLNNWNSEKWKTYWLYILLKRLVRITRGWEEIIYTFKGHFERGQEAINRSVSVSAALYMSLPFNTFLTNEYVKKYENPQAIEYVKILCNDLKIVFKRILMRNTWMQSSTKKYALKKLKHFDFIFGKPANLKEDPPLKYSTKLFDNLQTLNAWRHNTFVQLDGKRIVDMPMIDWSQYPVKMTGTQAYIVNASYTPSKNSIYINLGYIQKPFVDLDERGIEYNLAHIGFTIAHEMSHGFDDAGSKYGWDGNLNDWWSDADKKKYTNIQKDVIQQYELFAARDGIVFDASIGIGEDLADISGMAICDEYLRDFQEKNEDLIPIRNFGYEAFYTYFAYQQRQLVSKKALSAQLKTNPHPLDKYRCNIPLSRSIIYRAMYNVKKYDGMWWHNTDTVW